MSDNEDFVVLSTLQIQRVMMPSGRDAVVVRTDDSGDGLGASAVELLGMLRWAEHVLVEDLLAGGVQDVEE